MCPVFVMGSYCVGPTTHEYDFFNSDGEALDAVECMSPDLSRS